MNIEKDVFEVQVGCTCAGCCTIMKITHFYWHDEDDADYYITFYFRHPRYKKWGIVERIKAIFCILFGRDKTLSELVIDRADVKRLIVALQESLDFKLTTSERIAISKEDEV